MKRLTVVPQGGLCNRLRVILSAMALSRSFREGFVCVDWAVDDECKAAFSDLFEPFEEENFRVRPRRWLNIPPSRRNMHVQEMCRRLVYDAQLVNYSYRQDEKALAAALQRGRKVYVSTCYEIAPLPSALFRALRPERELESEVEELAAGFGDCMVGVHIRRTDNKQSRKVSTDDDFRRAMNREIETQPGTLFFLATDDLELKMTLQEEFPGRIMMQHVADVRRDTLGGMRQAVVDLFCLSRTQKVLGSYYSSFSETAAEIGGIPLEVVGSTRA